MSEIRTSKTFFYHETMVDDQDETSTINACEANGQENAQDQSPVSMPPLEVQNPNKGFQMGDWQTNGQGNGHEQSSPVQIPQIGVQNLMQGCEMGAWQTNGQGTAHEQSPPVQIPQMGVQNPIQGCEMGAWQQNGQGTAHEQSPPDENNSGASASPDLSMAAASLDPLPEGEKIEIFFLN